MTWREVQTLMCLQNSWGHYLGIVICWVRVWEMVYFKLASGCYYCSWSSNPTWNIWLLILSSGHAGLGWSSLCLNQGHLLTNCRLFLWLTILNLLTPYFSNFSVDLCDAGPWWRIVTWFFLQLGCISAVSFLNIFFPGIKTQGCS